MFPSTDALHPSVLLTRPEREVDDLATQLKNAGYRVHIIPTVALEPLTHTAPIQRVVENWHAYDWIVITSPAGADFLCPCLDARSKDATHPRWAVIGQGTASALARHNFTASAVPRASDTSSVVDAMEAHAPLCDSHVVLARADAADDDLPELLRQRGADVTVLDLYHTVEGPDTSRVPLTQAFADPKLGFVVFTSGSAVRGLLTLAGEKTSTALALRAITIGPKTTAVANANGWSVAAQASAPTVDALVTAVTTAIHEVIDD